MKRLLATLTAILTFGVVTASMPVFAAQTYSFSFDNVYGTVAGKVEGTITLDFLTSSTDSGIGQASEVRITSAPAEVPVSAESLTLTAFTYQAANRFEVVNGDIVDYEFGAAAAPLDGYNELVICLNNGSSFGFPSPASIYWFCGTDENWYGNGFDYVYNFGGIGAVTFVNIQPSAEELLTDLIANIIALNLHQGISNSLDGKLSSAFDALTDLNENNDVSVLNRLNAVLNEVDAQRGNKISDTDADFLMNAIQDIIDLL